MPRPVLALIALVALCLVAPAGAAQAAGAVPAAASAKKKKKCRAGFKRATVRKQGRKRVVCRRKRPRPAGPSVAQVESIIRGHQQSYHETWLGPESIEVTFERPTRVLPMRMYDPYAADPLSAAGPVPAWPVLAWVKSVNHRDDTPEDDTDYAGCLGHLNSWWPYDTLYMFFRGHSGEWTFLTSSDEDGECGA